MHSFGAWLKAEDGSAFECKLGYDCLTVIRVRKNDDFDYLYSLRRYHGTGIERRDKFEYSGIYCNRDGVVYDMQYNIVPLEGENAGDADALTL